MKRTVALAVFLCLVFPLIAIAEGDTTLPDKDFTLPLGIQWGISEEEAIASFAAIGVNLLHNTKMSKEGGMSMLYADSVPIIPDFMGTVYLSFYRTSRSGDSIRRLRLGSFNFIFEFDEDVGENKWNELQKIAISMYGVPHEDDNYWHFDETGIILSLPCFGSTVLHYESTDILSDYFSD